MQCLFISKRLVWWSLISFINALWTLSSSFSLCNSREMCSTETLQSKYVKFIIKCFYYTLDSLCKAMSIIIIVFIVLYRQFVNHSRASLVFGHFLLLLP